MAAFLKGQCKPDGPGTAEEKTTKGCQLTVLVTREGQSKPATVSPTYPVAQCVGGATEWEFHPRDSRSFLSLVGLIIRDMNSLCGLGVQFHIWRGFTLSSVVSFFLPIIYFPVSPPPVWSVTTGEIGA